MQLDQFDRKIVAALAEHGRLSTVDLAAGVGLSPSACTAARPEPSRWDCPITTRTVSHPRQLLQDASERRDYQGVLKLRASIDG